MTQLASLDPATFEKIAALAYRESGLTLVSEKTRMIESRLRHRLRALGLDSFKAYSAHVASEGGKSERRQLISALTTNVSHFFREEHHFHALCDVVHSRLPLLRAGGRFRIWSAGCSNGQEPISAALALLERMPEIAGLDLRILATDIDPKVVQFARAGRYPAQLSRGLPPDMCDRHFESLPAAAGPPDLQVGPRLRRMITYHELNLLAEWPMKNPFDIIFCRNVVIYFDAATQTRLWPRFRRALAPGGTLFLGHSERIAEPRSFGFSVTGPTMYGTSDAGLAPGRKV